MIFRKKVDRALKKQREENEDTLEEKLELEKNDFLAMLIAAFITFLPIAVLVLGGISLIGYFFLMH